MERVIGFVAVAAASLALLAYVMGAFETGQADLKEGQAQALVIVLRTAVNSVFANQDDLGSDADLSQPLIDLKKVPNSSLSGGAIVSPYGGGVEILGNDNRVAITLEELNQDECGRVASKFVGFSGVVNIEVADEAPDEVNDDAPADLTVTGVIDACDEDDGENALTITFR